MSAIPKLKYSVEEYLKLDQESEARLEFWDGEIFDMSGVNNEHDQIEGNIFLHLKLRTKDRGCRVFTANMRIQVPSMPPYRYGDVSALCGIPQYVKVGGVDALTNPALIIEVLSDSTESYDRGEKFSHYKSIPNFQEYLLIAHHRPNVSQFTRQPDGTWIHREFSQLEDVIQLYSLNCELSLREIYENVSFDQPVVNRHLRTLS